MDSVINHHNCVGTVLVVLLCALATHAVAAETVDIPDEAKSWSQLSSESIACFVHGRTVWLRLGTEALNARKAVIPRVSASIRSIRWSRGADAPLKFWPEQEEWIFSWKAAPSGSRVIEVVFDREPVMPADCPEAEPAGDDSIMLHAYQATTYGEKLRFEPQWYKNTVGYWAVETDYATWNLRINQPGTYSVAMLQGCGKGQGGSDAVVSLRQDDQVKAELPFKTIDTGHFQNFRWNHLGLIEVSEAGGYQLRIDATRIAKVALFDVRTIHLVRQAKSPE